MSAADQLAFLYPYFSDPADPRVVDAPTLAAATAMAETYRPPCLSAARGDLAVAHMIAHLLQTRADRIAAGQTASGAIAATGMVKSEKEGGVEVTYMTAAEQSGIVAQKVAATLSPYEEWKRLADICRVGGFTVSPIVSRPGWP